MDFLTLAGYVIAALAMALGLYLILRKNVADESTEVATDGVTLETDSAESETSGTQSSPSPSAHGIPVVPRHVREQLQASAVPASQPEQPIRQIVKPAPDADEDLLAQMPLITPERHSQVEDGDAEHSVHQAASISAAKHAAQNQNQNQNQNHNPNQNHNQNKADDFSENKPQATDFADSPLLMQQAQQLAESSKPDQDIGPDPFDQALAQLEAATTPDDADTPQPSDVSSSHSRTVETAAVEEWQGESALLDAHIEDQERRDDESALAQAEHIVALYVMPNASRALTGERTMHLLRQFGLRYGEMSLFHRFEDSDGTGPLMFSVLRYTSEGPSGFDLESLPNEQVEGLAFFLALPSKHAVAGYDTMVSISTLLAREIHGQVFDEHMNQLSPQLRDHYRHFVLEYRQPN